MLLPSSQPEWEFPSVRRIHHQLHQHPLHQSLAQCSPSRLQQQAVPLPVLLRLVKLLWSLEKRNCAEVADKLCVDRLGVNE